MKKTTTSIFIAYFLAIGALISCGNEGNPNASGETSEESSFTESTFKPESSGETSEESSFAESTFEPESSWPASSIQSLFDLYGYEGFEIPPFEVEDATYEIFEDMEYSTNTFAPEYASIKISNVFRSQVEEYLNDLSNHGYELQTFGSSYGQLNTDNGTAYLYVFYDTVDISVKLTYTLRKNGEKLHKWPEYVIQKYLTANVKEKVLEYTGQNDWLDFYVNTDGRLQVAVHCDDSEQALQTYILALRKAKWEKDGKEDNYWDRYVSPNKEIRVTPTAFNFVEQYLCINIESLVNHEDNPGDNTDPGGNNPGGNGNEPSGGNDPDPSGGSGSGTTQPEEGDWPENSINKSFVKHHVSDPFPSIKLGTKWVYEEVESEHTWFTLTTNIGVDAYNSSSTYTNWRATLKALNFKEDGSYTYSPSNQFMFTYKVIFTTDHEHYDIVITVMEVY